MPPSSAPRNRGPDGSGRATHRNPNAVRGIQLERPSARLHAWGESMDHRQATDEAWNGRGSPGLTLLLFASIVCAVTVGLYGAHPDEVTAVAAAEPIVAPPQSPIVAASLTEIADELLASPMFRDPEFLAEVGRWVRFWETTHSKWLPTYLERMTWFEDNVDAVLAAHELPWSLRFLPILESGYNPSAVSTASAVGLWQFMEPTARDFDMEVSRLVDERRDPFKSTEAAASFLGRLRTDFGSWFLALAAYNAGPDRIRGILERRAPGAVLSDSLYWAIRHHLPAETRDFVPKFLGAVVVAADPEAHGYEKPQPDPFVFDRVLVAASTSLAAVARAAGTSQEEITRLNPEFISGVTPPSRNTYVRVPVGSAQVVRENALRRLGDGPGS